MNQEKNKGAEYDFLRETSAAKSDSPWSAACIRYVRR